jgi:hypothetical protein
MMPSCSCFARRVKQISDNSQVVDFARPGYCAWGCFPAFWFQPRVSGVNAPGLHIRVQKNSIFIRATA